MANQDTFIKTIKDGYTFKGESVKIGAAMLDGQLVPEAGSFLPQNHEPPCWKAIAGRHGNR